MAVKRKKIQVQITTFQTTSLIDIVFLLVTFFMVVTEITRIDEIADLQLPSLVAARPDENPDPNRLVINVLKDGRIVVSGEARSDKWLFDALTTESRLHRDPATGICDRPILVRADIRTPFKNVRKLIMLCVDKNIKIWRMAFGTLPIKPEDAMKVEKEKGMGAGM